MAHEPRPQVVPGDRRFDIAAVSIGQALEEQADRSGRYPAAAPRLSPEQLCSDVVCLDDGDPELERAWATFPDPMMDHQGEQWQYMGTKKGEHGWKHAFRHRCHPETNARVNMEVSATTHWQPTPPEK